MPTPIRFVTAGLALEGVMGESETARQLAARLPLRLYMSRWGEEYYGDIGEGLDVAEEAGAREEMAVGELGFWPPGNALCVFFGPTPASEGEEPRAASAVNPLCVLEGDVMALASMGSWIEVTLEGR